MVNTLIITYQRLDLRDPDDRNQINQALNGNPEYSFHQSDGSLLPSAELLAALNAFTDENEAADLSLDELEQLSGGVGLPEALVSSTILMAMVAGASGSFVNSMGASSSSQIQDMLNAGIHSDIENVATFIYHNQESNGTYSDTLQTYMEGGQQVEKGLDFINANYVDSDSSLQGQEVIPVGSESVLRTMEADGNKITVTYTYPWHLRQPDTGNRYVIQDITMVAPAAGLCRDSGGTTGNCRVAER